MDFTKVELHSTTVWYVESPNGPKGASTAFQELEKRIGSLKGRKFYAIVQHINNELNYKACVEISAEDDSNKLQLDKTEIPGGKYARYKMLDWHQHIPEIGSTLNEMAEHYQADRSRPEVEFYYSQNELHLLLPVL